MVSGFMADILISEFSDLISKFYAFDDNPLLQDVMNRINQKFPVVMRISLPHVNPQTNITN